MKRLIDYYGKNFLLCELLIAIILVIVLYGVLEKYNIYPLVDNLLKGNRAAIYGTLASIFGSLLGFTITAASIVLGFSESSKLSLIRESEHYPTLWKVFSSTFRALGSATIFCIVSLIADKDSNPIRWIMYVCICTTLLSCLRVYRSVWVLENVIKLYTAPSKARSGNEDPKIK